MNIFRATAVAAIAASALAASAQITQVPLFTGTLNEGFEGYNAHPYVQLPNPASIMGGAAMLSTPDSQGYAVGDNVFGLGGPSAHPTSGSNLYGQNSTNSTTITFSNPVSDFGGYFNADRSSSVLTFSFFDALGGQIGTDQSIARPADGQSVFMGFASTTLIKSVKLSARYLVADDLRANVAPVPEPASMAALGLGAIGMLRRRKRA